MHVETAQRKARPDDPETIERLKAFHRTRDRALRNKLIAEHRWVAVVAARRFANRGEPLDDLIQVGLLGVLKAVERFDPEYGTSFATFALPTVIGELRRYFRDATWSIRVNRRSKELYLALGNVVEALTHDLGRSPTLPEIANCMRAGEEEVIEAMEVGAAYRPASLGARDRSDGSSVADDARALASEDSALATTDMRVSLRQMITALPERERQIVYLRFFEELTQSEIADRVGVSQVHVSRLLRSACLKLRQQLAAT